MHIYPTARKHFYKIANDVGIKAIQKQLESQRTFLQYFDNSFTTCKWFAPCTYPHFHII